MIYNYIYIYVYTHIIYVYCVYMCSIVYYTVL